MKLLIVFSMWMSSLAVAQIPSSAMDLQAPVVYGISPYYLGHGYPIKGLEAVRQRLPEIRALGANVIWLQPITTPAHEGQGYEVIDFEKIWPELGTPADLHRLVNEAHSMGMKIILDTVMNHSSMQHPFVRDILKKGKQSRYYSFYQHGPATNSPYSHFLHTKKISGETFTYYFWDQLLNFDIESLEVRQYLTSALGRWVTDYGIDGFRFDASWGPSSRYPGFYAEISQSLRKIRPDLILLAEDSVAYPAAYQGTGHPHLSGSGFDWAYDWNAQDATALSRWSFALDSEGAATVFNVANPERAAALFLRALAHGQSASGQQPLRYCENNDTPGLFHHHNLKQGLFAAATMLVLPGVPLIFYGQETGNEHEQYGLPSFDPQIKLAAINPLLWNFYQKMLSLRKHSPALSHGEISTIQKISPSKIQFVRQFKRDRQVIELDFKNHQVTVNGQALLPN